MTTSTVSIEMSTIKTSPEAHTPGSGSTLETKTAKVAHSRFKWDKWNGCKSITVGIGVVIALLGLPFALNSPVFYALGGIIAVAPIVGSIKCRKKEDEKFS